MGGVEDDDCAAQNIFVRSRPWTDQFQADFRPTYSMPNQLGDRNPSDNPTKVEKATGHMGNWEDFGGEEGRGMPICNIPATNSYRILASFHLSNSELFRLLTPQPPSLFLYFSLFSPQTNNPSLSWTPKSLSANSPPPSPLFFLLQFSDFSTSSLSFHSSSPPLSYPYLSLTPSSLSSTLAHTFILVGLHFRKQHKKGH